jgi:hypothetical protein
MFIGGEWHEGRADLIDSVEIAEPRSSWLPLGDYVVLSSLSFATLFRGSTRPHPCQPSKLRDVNFTAGGQAQSVGGPPFELRRFHLSALRTQPRHLDARHFFPTISCLHRGWSLISATDDIQSTGARSLGLSKKEMILACCSPPPSQPGPKPAPNL